MEILKGLKAHPLFVGVALMLACGSVFAQTIVVVAPNTVIGASKTYDDVTLDMSRGSFIVKNNATLTISNSTINGTLSRANPVLMNMENGNLVMANSKVSIKAGSLTQHPLTQSLETVMQVGQGNVNMKGNRFTIDTPFAAGLLITTSSIPTTGFQIIKNQFEKFHGVLYLIASDAALVKGNTFLTNTYGNIVSIGNNTKILKNRIFFSGNNHLGNSIDIIDSDTVTIAGNQLMTPTCHGIYVMNSRNVDIDGNSIHGGITYAMNIYSYPETPTAHPYLNEMLMHYKMKQPVSTNIRITNNYMSLNRFGIAASDVDGLVVENNYFIQSFANAEVRKFWTDNKTLLTKVSRLTWTNNLYKEGFSQDNEGDNTLALKFVPFPATGGVTL